MSEPSDLSMKPRFPETPEQRAQRLARLGQRLVAQVGRAAPAGVMPAAATDATASAAEAEAVDRLEHRLAGRLAAARPALAGIPALASARRIVADGLDAAQRLADGTWKPEDLTEPAMANLEAVIRVNDRPAWLVADGHLVIPPDPVSEFWAVHANDALDALEAACASVGCIFRDDLPIGTGWLVGRSTLITNAHVARHLARDKPGVGWRLWPGIAGTADFGFERAGARGPRLRVTDVLHVEASGDPDLALFSIEALGAASMPSVCAIELASGPTALPGTLVFTVGHPAADLNGDADNVHAVFGELDASKRLSPGKVTDVLGGIALAHDCSTTNGSSGGPLFDFVSNRVLGLHYFGRPGERNEAVWLAAIQDHPALAGLLGGLPHA